MKTVLMGLLTVIIVYGCSNSQYTIHISNQSSRSFDSIRVHISSSQGSSSSLLFAAVAPGLQVQQAVTDRAFYAKHDISIRPTLYAKDTVIKNWGTYNDLGVFHLNYELTIDSALQQNWELW
jgi:hypothetical protein